MKIRFLIPILCFGFCLSATAQQQPEGYLRTMLRQDRDMVATWTDTYAEMLTRTTPGIPKQFIVQADESIGITNTIYFWDGFKLNLIPSTVNIQTLIGNVIVNSINDLTFPLKRGFVLVLNDTNFSTTAKPQMYYSIGTAVDKGDLYAFPFDQLKNLVTTP
jgi:hypothetical protein